MEAALYASVLNETTAAIILVDERLGIIFQNAAAQNLLRRGDPVRREGSSLTVRSPAARLALLQAVRQAAVDEAAIGQRGLGVPLRSEAGTPFVLHVLPVAATRLRSGVASGAAAAIFVAQGDAGATTPADALAALFDLTPNEARVFAHVAAGMTPKEIGAALGVGANTVKSHLAQLFAKTGTRRQADIVRLAASLSLPL